MNLQSRSAQYHFIDKMGNYITVYFDKPEIRDAPTNVRLEINGLMTDYTGSHRQRWSRMAASNMWTQAVYSRQIVVEEDGAAIMVKPNPYKNWFIFLAKGEGEVPVLVKGEVFGKQPVSMIASKINEIILKYRPRDHVDPSTYWDTVVEMIHKALEYEIPKR